LEKARVLLAARLARRGIAVSAALLAALLWEAARGAGVPARLLVHTVEAAVTLTGPGTEAVSEAVARLVQAGLKKTAFGPTYLGAAVTGAVGLLGAPLLACQTLTAGPDRPPAGRRRLRRRNGLGRGNRRQLVRIATATRCRPPRWPHLGTVRWRHSTGLIWMAFAPDGKGLVTGGLTDPARL
jgi:hypothetical protein